MRYLQSSASFLRKVILVGWALAIVWIYLGNLVNFHQNHIWGKQLIPVSCYSTRAKEKSVASVVKNDGNLRLFTPDHQFDFTNPDHQVSNIPYFTISFTLSGFPDTPFTIEGLRALSFRGPPTA
jgi:hypothetical protein